MCPVCTHLPTRKVQQSCAIPMAGEYLKMLLTPVNPMELQVSDQFGST